ELAQLGTTWTQATTTRQRRIALVAGEPGIGKTRLAAALAAMAVEHGTVLHGWCDEDVAIAYEPWVHALGGFVRSCDADALHAIPPLAPNLARLLPDLATRLPDLAPAPAADADTERARVFDAVDALLEVATEHWPMLLVLDDLHWADQPSLSLLRWVLRSDRA